jgi:hypothetical protein
VGAPVRRQIQRPVQARMRGRIQARMKARIQALERIRYRSSVGVVRLNVGQRLSARVKNEGRKGPRQ